MSYTDDALQDLAPIGEDPSPSSAARSPLVPMLRRSLSFRNVSVLDVFVIMFVIFALWVPSTFLTWGVWRTLFDEQAITVIAAIGLTIPLAAGAVDLAVGMEVGFGAIIVAWLLVDHGVPIVPAIALSVVAGGLVGLAQGLLITRARIDAIIATLGVSSLLTALIAWISGSTQILNLGTGFESIGLSQVLGLTLPVWIMLGLAVIVWYVMERTPVGRRVYATGGNIEGARLAGVNTGRVLIGAMVTCGILAAIAGLLASSQIDTGDPTIGPGYLLPTFSAAFLGSTQFRAGRFNVWGTVAAAYTLAVGVKGLQLAGAPVWLPDLFNGAALLLAVGLARYERTSATTAAIGRLTRRRSRPVQAS
jgi:ribose transport system permease protein